MPNGQYKPTITQIGLDPEGLAPTDAHGYSKRLEIQ
jgi:hypothetical protein